ncbi:MAG: PEPxxWA-CTERM sorting domain-containing protein [Pseudomonadota bacterium]
MKNLLKSQSLLSRALLAGSAIVASLAVPGMAQATEQLGPAASVSPCTNFTFNVAILACSGGYSGNLLQDSLTDPTGLAALAALGGPASGAYLEPKLSPLSSDDGIINFGTLLTGMTIFGMHAGGAGDGGQGTFFFRFDAGAGVDVILVTDRLNSNATGLSNAALFQTTVTSVPEPSSWAMMLFGFGALGVSLRRRRKQFLQAA